MCKFCDAFWDWFWKKSDEWERAHSNEGRLEESERSRALIDRAFAVEDADPASAFQLFLEAAEEGSAWSLGRVGWHYQTGTAVAADDYKALEYYHRAICAGSWMATISYARLLAELGHHDRADSVLKDGIASDFVPAYFWLARLRYDRSRTRKVCGEVRPFLEYAASKGHPAAQSTLARWMVLGKFGPGEILGGVKLVLQMAFRLARTEPA